MPFFANLLGFQSIWLALVYGALSGMELLPLVLLSAWLIVHLIYSKCPTHDVQLIIAAVTLGPLCDTVLIQLGLIRFEGTSPLAGLPPWWVYALWANFALLPNHSLGALWRKRVFILVTACISAPLAYAAGVSLGAAEFLVPQQYPLLMIAGLWTLILTALRRVTFQHRQLSAEH